jgi:hypothetical protein
LQQEEDLKEFINKLQEDKSIEEGNYLARSFEELFLC